MISKIISKILLFILIPSFLYSQRKKDSIVYKEDYAKEVYFYIKNNADGIIFLRNKLKVLWKKNNMDSNLLNTKVHHNH